MGTTDFFGQVKIDRTGGVPLNVQLERSMEDAFARLEPGTKIPPERQIAETLQISRVTVRSVLQRFCERGLIVRRRRLGTRIAGRNRPGAVAFHPLALGPGGSVVRKSTMKFLLFEDLPVQKIYWSKMTDAFNADHPGSRVELAYLPHRLDVRRIGDVVRSESVDILMVSDSMPADVVGELRELPESIRSLYRSGEFLFDRMTGSCPEAFRYLLPMAVVFPLICWNEDLAQELHLGDVRGQLRRDGMGRFLTNCAPHLPEDFRACGHLWDYFAMANLPELADDPSRLYRSLQTLAELGRRAGHDRGKLFLTEADSQLECAENFVSGRQLTLPAYAHLLHCFPKTSFHLEKMPFPKADNGKLLLFGINLALTKNRMDVPAAEEFLHFLLSPENQRQGGLIRQDCPVRRAEAAEYLERNQMIGRGGAEAFFDRLLFCNGKNPASVLQLFMVYGFREKLIRVLNGTMTCKEAVESFERKWKSFKDKVLL